MPTQHRNIDNSMRFSSLVRLVSFGSICKKSSHIVFSKNQPYFVKKGLIFCDFFIGRSDRIRTCGLLVPNQAHYQTVPHPEKIDFVFCFLCAIGEGTEPPNAVLRLRLRTYQTVPHPDLKFVLSVSAYCFAPPCAIGEGTEPPCSCALPSM